LAFQNPSPAEIWALLERIRTVAVVGLSNDPDRPSYSVASYLQGKGYRIVPVRPGGGEILGEKVYARLSDVPFAVDAVNIFRKSAAAGTHVDEAIALAFRRCGCRRECWTRTPRAGRARRVCSSPWTGACSRSTARRASGPARPATKRRFD